MYHKIQEALLNEPYPLEIAKQIAKPIAMNQFNKRALSCKCCEKCTKTVEQFLWGNPNGTVLVLFSSPESLAIEQVYLNNALEGFDIDPSILSYAYAIQGEIECTPTQTLLTKCSKFLEEAIEIIEPVSILCLSTYATSFFNTKHLDDNISSAHYLRGIGVYTTYPPAHLLTLHNKESHLFEEKQKLFYEAVYNCFEETAKRYPNLCIYKEI